MRSVARFGWIVFVFFAVLATLFGVFPGTWFDEGGDRGAPLLTTTYAAIAVTLTVMVATTAFRRGERWAWFAFWAWPVFFVVHGVAFFKFDFVFAALGVATLAITAPTRERPVSPAGETGP